MTTWNYRIVHYRGGGFGLHEVYYREDGTPSARTEEPCGFAVDEEEGVEGLMASLGMAMADAVKRPTLEEPDSWPGPEDEK